VIIAVVLLPPGLLCLVLVLGRYEEWAFRGPREAPAPRHAGRRRHLSLVRGTGPSRHSAARGRDVGEVGAGVGAEVGDADAA
jgi:hypothetical protein